MPSQYEVHVPSFYNEKLFVIKLKSRHPFRKTDEEGPEPNIFHKSFQQKSDVTLLAVVVVLLGHVHAAHAGAVPISRV